MTKFALLTTTIAVMQVALLPAAPAHAADHTWVSGSGSGTACTRAAPCASFQTAHDLTTAGGVISVLDSGDFGKLIINRSIVVRAEGADGGSVNAGGTGTGYWIIVSAGASDVVSIEGLHIMGSGVRFNSGKSLHIRNSIIENHYLTPFQAIGISFGPSGASKLVITDTAVINNGSGSTGGGIVIQPSSAGSASVYLERVSVEGNVFGIVADGTGSTAGINMTISNSAAASNSQDGIIAVTPGGGAPIGVMVKNTRSINNGIGIRSIGPNVTVRVDGSTIIGNGTGLSFGSGGGLLSFGNNNVVANGTNGAFSGSVGLQ